MVAPISKTLVIRWGEVATPRNARIIIASSCVNHIYRDPFSGKYNDVLMVASRRCRNLAAEAIHDVLWPVLPPPLPSTSLENPTARSRHLGLGMAAAPSPLGSPAASPPRPALAGRTCCAPRSSSGNQSGCCSTAPPSTWTTAPLRLSAPASASRSCRVSAPSSQMPLLQCCTTDGHRPYAQHMMHLLRRAAVSLGSYIPSDGSAMQRQACDYGSGRTANVDVMLLCVPRRHWSSIYWGC